jgi:hypothetical protein
MEERCLIFVGKPLGNHPIGGSKGRWNSGPQGEPKMDEASSGSCPTAEFDISDVLLLQY